MQGNRDNSGWQIHNCLDVVGKMKERVNEKEGDVTKEGQENKAGK